MNAKEQTAMQAKAERKGTILADSLRPPTAFELACLAAQITAIEDEGMSRHSGSPIGRIALNFPKAMELLRSAQNFLANYDEVP